MKVEDIKRAVELEKEIAECNHQIDKWNNIESLSHILGASFTKGNNGWSQISSKHIPITVIRAVSLEGFKKDLEELQKELASL